MGLIADYITDGALIAFPFDEAHTAGNDTFTADNDGAYSASFTETSNIASLGTGFDCADCEAISTTALLNGTSNLGSVAQNTPYSISFFFQHDSGTSAWKDALNQGYGVQFQYDTATEQLRVIVWWFENEVYLYTGAGSIPSGEQHHIALTVDPSTGVAILYLDGTPVDSDDQLSAQTFDWSNTLQFGASFGSPSYTFQGLAIFDSVLSASKVSEYAGIIAENNQPVIVLEWILPTGQPFILLEWTGYKTGQPVIPLEWILPTGQPYIPLHWVDRFTGQPSIALEWVFPDVSGFPETSESWSLEFIIGGVSFGSRFSGTCRVDIEEDSSRIADFTILHETGSIDPMSYIGKQVQIDVTAGGNTVRLFNGVVSNAVFNANDGTLDFSCTDDLQGHFENADKDYIASVIGGYWSSVVFNESDGWAYCQDRMSTQYKSLHLDINKTPVLTDLTAKETPDFTFTDAESYDTDIVLSRATRRDLLNRVRLTYEYSFTRKKQRNINYVWEWQNSYTKEVYSMCDYLVNNYNICERDQVQRVIDSTGWSVLGDIQWTEVPYDTLIECPGAFGPNMPQGGDVFPWLTTQEVAETLCFAAQWTLSKRFAQTVTEAYKFDIVAPNSQEYIGEVGLEQKFTLVNPYDESSWEDEPFDSVAAGMTLDDSGDYYIDETSGDNGRDASDNAQQTALAQAVVDIKKRHRANTITREVPFHPAVDLIHTVKFENTYVEAQGKVRQIVHEFNSDTADCSTTISLALSLHGGSGVVTDTALDPVAQPTVETETYDSSHYLGYYMGGESNSPAFNEDMEGYLTNRDWYSGNYPRYEIDFRMNTPEIAESFRETTVPFSKTITVDIPEDTLLLSA